MGLHGKLRKAFTGFAKIQGFGASAGPNADNTLDSNKPKHNPKILHVALLARKFCNAGTRERL